MKEEKITITNAQELRQEKCNVPTLRFKSFEQEWEYSTIGKCSISLEYGMNAAAVKYDGKHKYIRITDIDEETNAFIPNPLSSPDGEFEQRYLVKENDILFARTGASVGKSYLYNSNDGELYFAGFLIRARIKPEYNGPFIYYQTKSKKYDRWVKLTSMRSGQPGINSQEYSGYPIAITGKVEQDKIAYFFQMLDNRISAQNKIISKYETLIKGIREQVVNGGWQWKKLDELIQKGIVRLNRGNIIPKHQKDNIYKYPVYSSSTQNNGLMGYNDTYMFDKELITWSIDGGGNFFYRKKHKFNVTNVCGIMQVDENIYSYRFIAEMLTYQHSKMKFDYQSKAHPSVISSLYSLPCLPISEQNSYCRLFIALDRKIQIEQQSLCKLKEQKKYLLSKMFI